MRRRSAMALAISLVAASAALIGQPVPTGQTPTFRAGINLVLVDVVVRDRSGAIVKGLTADDFELLEDGVRQPILTFAYEEISRTAATVAQGTALATVAASSSPTPAAPETPTHPLTSDEVAGHRLLTLVFDTSSMQPEDVQKAVDGATTWVDSSMSAADLVAVASIGSSLQVLTDFTSSKERLHAVLS